MAKCAQADLQGPLANALLTSIQDRILYNLVYQYYYLRRVCISVITNYKDFRNLVAVVCTYCLATLSV